MQRVAVALHILAVILFIYVAVHLKGDLQFYGQHLPDNKCEIRNSTHRYVLATSLLDGIESKVNFVEPLYYYIHPDHRLKVEGMARAGHGQVGPLGFFLADFDVFALDHGGAFSGLHGRTLLHHAQTTVRAIEYILHIYSLRWQRDSRDAIPENVIIVGHSMGGVVARLALTLRGYQAGRVKAIYTVAAPHYRPIVSVDKVLVHMFRQIEEVWSQKSPSLEGVSLVVIPPTPRDRLTYSDSRIRAPLAVPNLLIPTGALGLCPDHNDIMFCDKTVNFISEMIVKGCENGAVIQSASLRVNSIRLAAESHGLAPKFIDDPESRSERSSKIIVNFPLDTFGWREYWLYTNSSQACPRNLRIRHIASGEESVFTGKCSMALRFTDHRPGISIDDGNPSGSRPRYLLKVDWSATLAGLMRRNFQFMIAMIIVFCLQLLWFSTKTEEVPLGATPPQLGGRVPRKDLLHAPWVYIRLGIIVLLGETLSFALNKYGWLDGSEGEARWLVVLLGMTGTSCIVLLALSFRWIHCRIKNSKEDYAHLGSSTSSSNIRHLNWRSTVICLVLGLLLPSVISFSLAFGLLLVHCIRLVLSKSEDLDDHRMCFSLLMLMAIFSAIELPVLIGSFYLWSHLSFAWSDYDPVLVLPLLTLVLFVRAGTLTSNGISKAPIWLKVYLAVAIYVLSICTMVYGPRNLYWPPQLFSLLAIPLLINHVFE